MKSRYEDKLNKMMQYYEDIRESFKWENDMARHLVALTYAMKEKELDTIQIKEVKDYIKSNTGMFSPFRGHMMFAMSGLLCANSDSPKDQFKFMIDNEKILKSIGFKNSTYLPTALYALLSVYEGDDVSIYGEKAMQIYKEMKQNHPFLTSGDDYALSILLASTDHNTDILEDYYQELNSRGFSKSNGLQMLSHVMAFSKKDVRYSVDKCENIYNYLKKNKFKIYADYYPAIGLISLIDSDKNELMVDLVEIATHLKKQKRYKWLGKGMNLLMASAIITSEYIKEKSGDMVVDTTLNVSIQAIIAAQQATMIAAITASTVAATSTSN